MQIAVFSTKPYDRQFLDAANAAAADKCPGGVIRAGTKVAPREPLVL